MEVSTRYREFLQGQARSDLDRRREVLVITRLQELLGRVKELLLEWESGGAYTPKGWRYP